MTTAAMTRHDMVERQVMRSLPAVLAGKSIPPENLSAG
jgi:hypothetical protein